MCSLNFNYLTECKHNKMVILVTSNTKPLLTSHVLMEDHIHTAGGEAVGEGE